MKEIELEAESGGLEARTEARPALGEFQRRCALEREDRLLFVADRKHGARDAIARAVAGGKFGNDVLDNVPLSRARVLRLIYQDVVDAAVELVMHPARRHLGQHGKRLVDQIVIIEQAALLLFAPVVCGRRYCDMQQGLGAVAGNHGTASVDQGRKAQNLCLEQAGDRGIIADECPGQDGRTRRFVVGEKDAEIFIDLGAARKAQASAQLFALVLVRLAAAIERGCDVKPARARRDKGHRRYRARRRRGCRSCLRQARPTFLRRRSPRCRLRRSRP